VVQVFLVQEERILKMTDEERKQAWQQLKREIVFLKGEKAAMDEAVAYAKETGGDTAALHRHIQRIRHERSYPLRIFQYIEPPWEPDYQDKDFLAGIQAGFDACEQIYGASDWEEIPFSVDLGAPSKIVHHLRIALLEVDGRIYGLEECFDYKDKLEELPDEIASWKRNTPPNHTGGMAHLKALQDGYALLTGQLGNT
jgi:hypothetical protein